MTDNFNSPYMVALRKAATLLLHAKQRAKMLGPKAAAGPLFAAQKAYKNAYEAAEKAGVLCRDLA